MTLLYPGAPEVSPLDLSPNVKIDTRRARGYTDAREVIVSPGEAVLEASGLTRRRFAGITRASMRGGRLEEARVETCAAWIARLADAGIRVELGYSVSPDGIVVNARRLP